MGIKKIYKEAMRGIVREAGREKQLHRWLKCMKGIQVRRNAVLVQQWRKAALEGDRLAVEYRLRSATDGAAPITSSEATTVEKNPRSVKLKKSLGEAAAHLLPKDFPHSVQRGYLSFSILQASSAVVSSAGGVLSMQCLLHSLGLGTVQGALPLAATLQWILKDGLGQIGGILFASFVNNKFDANPKKWRFIAALTLELSNLIELSTPFAPAYFLPLAAIANTGKNISYLAASASRAAIHRSFALQENLADITVKTGSQNIVSSLIGTSLGIAAAAMVGNDMSLTFAAFLTLSSSSLALTYASLHHVTVTNLTLERLKYIAVDYFEQKRKFPLRPADLQKLENGWFFDLSYPSTLGKSNSICINPSLELAFKEWSHFKV